MALLTPSMRASIASRLESFYKLPSGSVTLREVPSPLGGTALQVVTPHGFADRSVWDGADYFDRARSACWQIERDYAATRRDAQVMAQRAEEEKAMALTTSSGHAWYNPVGELVGGGGGSTVTVTGRGAGVTSGYFTPVPVHHGTVDWGHAHDWTDFQAQYRLEAASRKAAREARRRARRKEAKAPPVQLKGRAMKLTGPLIE